MTGKEDGGSQNSTVKKRIIRKSVKPCDEMRQDNLTWDEYFMGIARLSAERSKDPVTRSGACIVDPDNRIVGIGYNGMPIGCPDHQLPWKMESDNIVDRKETYACHAEINAILNKNSGNLKGCTMFTDSFPCNECAKAIIQSGIGQVVYLRDRNPGDPVSIASRKLLTMAGIGIRLFESKRNPITISLQPADPAE